MIDNPLPKDQPCYVISVAAELVSLHPQRLRYYERIGLVKPSRTAGRQRLYSRADIEKLLKISRLTVDLGVNLAGVEVILNMNERINELQNELAEARQTYLEETRKLIEQIERLEKALADQQPVHVRRVDPDATPGIDIDREDSL